MSAAAEPIFGAPEDVTVTRGDGLTLAAHLWRPVEFSLDRAYPALLVGGAVTMVKEQAPDNYAQFLAEEGFVVLTFDYASYGESEGQPRQNENVSSKFFDLKACVTYLRGLPFVDKIGVVGICTSGGNVAYLAAEEDRLSAMASVIPWMYEPGLSDKLWGPEKVAQRDRTADDARQRYAERGEYLATQIFTNSPDVEGFNLGAAEYFFDKWRSGKAPTWRNEVWWGSWEEWAEVYDPIGQASRIKVPALVFSSDAALLPDQARKFYEALPGEKQLAWGDGYHFNYYDLTPNVVQALNAVVPFMRRHLA